MGTPAIPSQTDAFQAKTDVLNNAGATVPVRDSVDVRVINDVKNGTGNALIRLPDDVGGYPTINAGTPYTDTDADGMSDAYETANGLNPNYPSDGPVITANGYSNLENFLHTLAGGMGPPLPPSNLLITQE